ncbi:hypothetical protein BH10ACT9_BH10ACT9_18110 [soil metagenome]
MNEPTWLREPPAAAYAAILDAAELCARFSPDSAREQLAARAFEIDVRWLANAAVRALARLVRGPGASVWWARLRQEVNTFTDPARQLEVVCALEVLAVAEAVERGAFGRVEEVIRGTQFAPADLAAVAAQYVGLIAAHLEAEQVGDIAETMARLRAACGLSGGE